MKKLTDFFKPLRLSRFVTVLVLCLAMLLTTACNNGNLQGARPNNPPVQAGGQNNPYKQGGDGYTEYKTPGAPGTNRTEANAKTGYDNSRQYRGS